MKRQDVRNIVTAFHFALLNAVLVFVISIVIGTPRVWPGTIASFLVTGCVAWRLLDRCSGGRR